MYLVPPSMQCLRFLVAGNLAAATRTSGLSFDSRRWPDDVEMREGLSVHLYGCEQNPRDRLWRVYVIAADDETAIGHVGFKGGPSREGELEMYWCVEPRFRQRGIAKAAAVSLAEHAFRQPPVHAIIATIAPHNVPSQRVATAVGMKHADNEVRHGLPLWRLTRDMWRPVASTMTVATPVFDAVRPRGPGARRNG